MFWTISRRAIASIVGFLLGWTVFLLVRPAEIQDIRQSTAGEISSITIKHHGCGGVTFECQVNDATFHRNGLAVYVGYANDEYIGTYAGYIDPKEFQDLVSQLYLQRFFDLPQHYAPTPAEGEVVLEVVTNEGVRRVTTQNWSSMGIELRTLHALIDEQVYRVDWSKAD